MLTIQDVIESPCNPQNMKPENNHFLCVRELWVRGDLYRQIYKTFVGCDETGLPADDYSEAEVGTKTDDVFRHVFRVYPTVPSPHYENAA